MRSLEPPDRLHLEAAQGWLILGNHIEADNELDRIAPQCRAHPDVLVIRWLIRARAEKWSVAFEIARTLVEQHPENPFGWIYQAYALRWMEGAGIHSARDALLPAAHKFPNEPTIAFNLACYACQLGNLKEANDWLQKAIDLGGKKEIKTRALNDPDLEPLWPKISEL